MKLLSLAGFDSGFSDPWIRARLLEQINPAHQESVLQPKESSSNLLWSHAAVVAFFVGTGGLLTADYVAERSDRGYRLQAFEYRARPAKTREEETPARGPAEDLNRVRDVFRPTVTELASLFGVSRQTIYNWQAGQPIADQNATRLSQLAKAADVLEAEGLADQPRALRRKLAGGKDLFEAVRDGADAETVARTLGAIIRRELAQREALSGRLANRPRKPLDEGEIGAPHLDERA